MATDLRGYGDSGKPRGRPDHSNYSFHRMAQDQVEVMQHLGFERFMVAGHDRGARTAYRMALDHPATILKLAEIDILPTHRAGATIDYEMETQDFEAGSRITCLVLVIVGGQSHTAKLYGYEQAWSAYLTNLVRCVALPCGHYPAEQAPDETYAELRGFFAR